MRQKPRKRGLRWRSRLDCDTDYLWDDNGPGELPALTVYEGQPFRIGFLQYPDKPAEPEKPDRFAKWREFRGRNE